MSDDSQLKKLWNPQAACNWSLLLTAGLGSYLQYKNWKMLGENDKARISLCWFYGILAFFLVLALMPDQYIPFPPITRRAQFLILIVWYYVNGRSQVRFVKEQLGANYEKKKWGAPLGIAFLSVIGYIVFSRIIDSVYEAINITPAT